MSKIYLEILDEERLKVFNKLSLIFKDAVLTGGTALALQLGHRTSVDFDLTLKKPVEKRLLRKVNEVFSEYSVTPKIDQPSELTVVLSNNVKLTFFHYPFPNLHPLVNAGSMKLDSVSDIASNKAHTVGRRGEWKDYFDIYSIITKTDFQIDNIIEDAEKRFAGEFDEKLFWEQLVYWGDITDFEIQHIGKIVSAEKVKDYLRRLVMTRFKKKLASK